MSKTFKDLNFTFEIDSSCMTCRDGFCLSNATLKSTNEDCNISVFTNPDFTDIQITVSYNSNTDSNVDLEQFFDSEDSAVEFLCDSFNGFKCS